MAFSEPTTLPAEEFQYTGPNFENCKTASAILRTCLAMNEAGDTLSTHQLTGQQLARSLERVAQLTLDMYQERMASGISEQPDANEIDGLLAQNGITSQGGLRDAVQVLIEQQGRLKFRNKDFDILDKAIGRGRYHPVYILAQQDAGAFTARFPDTWFAEHQQPSPDDTEETIAAHLAWREHQKTIARDSRAKENADAKAWRKDREGIVLSARDIIDPSSSDSWAQYKQYQSEVSGYLQDQASKKQAQPNRVEIFEHASLVPGSAGEFVAGMIKNTAETNGRVLQLNTLIGMQPLRGEQQETIGRTLRLPLDDGHNSITITLLSNSGTERTHSFADNRDVPVENPLSIRGAVIESIGDINLTRGDTPSGEQSAMLSSVWRLCSLVEDNVQSRTGLNLGLRERLRQLAQKMGV